VDVLAMLAAAAAATLTIQSPASVQAVAADGYRVAYAAGFSAADCNRIYVWNLRTRGLVKLGRRTHCVQTSTGNGISSVALAGTRALWLQYQGGNRRDYTLWTATTARPRPILVSSREVDVDDPAPIVLGAGGSDRAGDMLPWAAGSTVRVLRANGSRRFSWTAPGRVVALHARDGELAVATDSAVTILDASGDVIREESYDGPIRGVRVTGNGVLAQVGNRLDLRDGSGTRTWPIPVGSRLEDADTVRALYFYRGELRSLRFAPFVDRPVATASRGRLEGQTLVTVSGRTVRAAPFR
jgi:hypothetical protein